MLAKELRVFASCLSLLWLVGCGAGNVALREARKAELRKDWDTALVNYEKAGRDQPENAKIIIHEKLVRVQAAALHLKQGQRLLREGRPDEASGEFQKAVSIDPTNEAAAQELARVVAAQAADRQARESALKRALKASEEAAKVPAVKLKAFPEEPLAHFRVSADSRKVFEALAKLANMNVAFTATFRPGPLSEDLSNVKVEEALNIVALQTHTFWRAITSNTILVVPDTPTDRRDYDVEELKTIYLSNPLAAADRTAITTALKQVLGLQRIIDNPDSNAIIIRDTPQKVAAAEQLVHDLDRSKAEIVMDVSVVEADRDRARDLGLYPATVSSSGTITPGLSGGMIFAPPVSASSTGTSTAQTGLSLSNPWNDFALVVPSVVANAVLNDTRTHILQNPQVRSTDGQTAKLSIGQRVPYATGSFLPSLGATTSTSGTTGLLASTQFQFQDVGVKLELTPHLLVNGEVSIHASIEISSLGAPSTIAGVSEPTFGERKIEHDIRLKEGEVSVLGGLIQTTFTNTVSGVPFVGDIPVLRYLFSSEHVERQETEVLVMLTPRVVRLPEPPSGAQSNVTLAGEPQPTGLQPVPGPEIPGQPPGEPQ
jgi:general secretion pathway protein D